METEQIQRTGGLSVWWEVDDAVREHAAHIDHLLRLQREEAQTELYATVGRAVSDGRRYTVQIVEVDPKHKNYHTCYQIVALVGLAEPNDCEVGEYTAVRPREVEQLPPMNAFRYWPNGDFQAPEREFTWYPSVGMWRRTM